MSKLNKVKAMLKAMLQEFGDVSTDRGTLVFDGDELEIGLAVKLLDSEGNEIEAEDGEYITDDKKKIVIADGKVESIDDVEEPEVTEEDPAPAEEELSKKAQAFRAMVQAFDESYEERYQQISAAISEKGFEYFYIVEASDAYAVISVWDEETNVEKFYKFDLTWSEDGMVSVSEPVEVKKEFVPKDEEPEQEEEKPAEEPAEEPKEEEEQESAALSAQEAFAKLDDKQPNSKVNAKVEALLKRGYKMPKQ